MLELEEASNLTVVVGGRRLEAAESLATELGVEARLIDLADPATWPSACQDVDLVVMCMDQAVLT